MSARPEVAVLFTDGTNCDRETIEAFNLAGADAQRVHVSELEAGGEDLADYEALAIPGGFSYGDDVASGKVLAVELETQLAEQVRAFTERDEKPVIGICNGFQVLVKSGLLPEGSLGAEQRVTLTDNDSNRFECRWVDLRVDPENRCVFLDTDPAEYHYLKLQVAHGEGKLVVPSAEWRELELNRQIVFQYVDDAGTPTERYPANPNGSVKGITGITDKTGRILGMMPHPERSVRADQHPNQRRYRVRREPVPTDGLPIFEQLVEYVRQP